MHVVVVGGGIGGLCTAASLLSRGMEVTVLEAAQGAAADRRRYPGGTKRMSSSR